MDKTGATLGQIGAYSGLPKISMVLAIRSELADMKRAENDLSDNDFYLP